jgi:hypothetical protein
VLAAILDVEPRPGHEVVRRRADEDLAGPAREAIREPT